MRRFIIPVIIGSMLISVAACNKTESTEGTTAAAVQSEASQQIPNPWSDYADLKEANAAAGTAFVLPDEYKTTSTVYRAMSGDMLEIRTKAGEYDVCFRTRNGNSNEDISGDVNSYSKNAELKCMDIFVRTKSNAESEVVIAYWNDGNADYSISFSSPVPFDFAQEVFTSIIEANTYAY